MKTLNNMTYEDLREEARKRSLGGYAAIVEIVTYMGSESFMTVASGNNPIKSHSRGGRFVGVGSQFRNGEPMYKAPVPQPAMADDDSDELPF